MLSTFLLLALIAAVFFGLEPVLSKRGLTTGGTWFQNTIVMLAVRTGLFWAALLIVTGGVDPLAGMTLRVGVVFAIASIISSAVGRGSFYAGVHRTGSSISSAVTNFRPFFAVIFAGVWLGEAVSPLMGLGVVLLIAGLIAITFSGGGDIEGWRRVDLLFPLLAATLFAAGNVIRRFGFTISSVSALQAIAVGEGVALVVVVAYAAVRGVGFSASRTAYGYFMGSGAMAAIGLLALFEALRRGPVSVADPVASLAPVFTVAFAVVWLGDIERITGRLVVGVGLAMVGVFLIS